MATAKVNGLNIEYELHGDEGEAFAITCGGRFSMDTPGYRELAQALAAGGKRALIWDRPNCGASDVSFDAASESTLHADTLAGLVQELDLGKVVIAGGSAGSRVSLLTYQRHPEIASKLALWWISGGNYGLIMLAAHYCGGNFAAAKTGGMEAVVALPEWQEQLAKNPGNRDRFLAMDPEQFAQTMSDWMPFYLPSPDSPVPGMRPEDFAAIDIPVLIFNSSPTDIFHTRRTTEWVHELTPTSRLIDPPWGPDEWNERQAASMAAAAEGRESPGLFNAWPKLAPILIDFVNEPVGAAR